MHEETTIPELTEVVARLSALLGPRERGVMLLEGGITNRNYRVNFDGTDYVVRLPGKDTDLLRIDRETERLATRRAAELGLGPKVAAMLDAPPCLVTCFIPTREVTAEDLREPEAIGEIAQGLRQFHETDLELPTDFQAVDVARHYAEVVRGRGDELPGGFEETLARAGEVVQAVHENPEHTPVPCHNDLLSSNFLHDGQKVVIVDWEYAGMGDRFFDLGNFAANNELSDDEEDRLLEAYFGEPTTPRRQCALKLFRFLSDFREGIWGALQSSVSSLDFDFEGYAVKHFRRLAGTSDDPRFHSWIREASGSSS